MSSVLYDEPGPRAKRVIRIGTVVGLGAVIGLLGLALFQLYRRDLFAADRWDIFVDPDVWQFLGNGLLATLRAAGVAAVIAVVIGITLAVLRMSSNAFVRWPVTTLIELFRGLPVLLLMFFTFIGFGVDSFTAVVVGLAIYNGAVIGEILRAGIQSLPRGQREAAYAIGLSDFQTLILILLPQAIRRMLPSLVSQLVVLLKDTSLGYIVLYPELLRSVQNLRDFFGGQYLFSVFFVAAAIYITVNFMLSRTAVFLEKRGTKKAAGGTAHVKQDVAAA